MKKWSVLLFAIAMVAMVSYGVCASKDEPAVTSCYDPIPLSIPKYDFIRYDLNKLDFPMPEQGQMAFEGLYSLMDSVIFYPDAHLNIVHMGGSHVQAGVLSHRMRQHFQHFSCDLDAERGFFFPYRLAKTNGPRHFSTNRIGEWNSTRCAHNKQKGNWGITGFEAWSVSDTSGLDIVAHKQDSSRYQFDEVWLLHEGTLEPQWSYPFPDSVVTEKGISKYYFNHPQDSVSLRFYGNQLDSIIVHGMSLRNKNRAITYNALGVNGASTKSYLRCPKIFEEMSLLNADLVIFGVGINDAYMSESRFDSELFEARYDSLVQGFLKVNPNTAFLWLTNNDSYYKRRYPNKNALEVKEVMYRLASKHNGACWDLFEIMGGLGSIRQWELAGLAKKDKIHFTGAGYQLQADLLFDAIRQDYTQRLHERNMPKTGQP
ncbi:MAG: GDSL-type esterase/lipase family protein [Bacteroidota bacterium]